VPSTSGADRSSDLELREAVRKPPASTTRNARARTRPSLPEKLEANPAAPRYLIVGSAMNEGVNIAFFLTPKSEVVWVPESATMHEALELMERYRYTAIPVLDDHGRYTGTLTEGDLLWKLKHTAGLTFGGSVQVPLAEVPRHTTNRAVGIDARIGELLSGAIAQNFVPVVDSRGVFIGIVRRRPIIEYCAGLLEAPRGG
jgi:CBS domain-containing protein